MLREKLGSITDHCANIHSFPDNAEHKCCAHLPLGPDEDRSKGWMDPDSLVCYFHTLHHSIYHEGVGGSLTLFFWHKSLS